MNSNGEQCSYKQLWTPEDFDLFLIKSQPDAEWVDAHLGYADFWFNCMRNGGSNYIMKIAQIAGAYKQRLIDHAAQTQEQGTTRSLSSNLSQKT